jgi:ATP-dependent protease Clp ATPase subunit
MILGRVSKLMVMAVDVGDDVENAVLRLLQASDYDVTRTECVHHYII